VDAVSHDAEGPPPEGPAPELQHVTYMAWKHAAELEQLKAPPQSAPSTTA
jgi:hypothetical protein